MGGTLEYKAGYRSVALINQDSDDMLLTERLKAAQISNINRISRQVLGSELLYRQMLLINIIAENASWLVGVEFNNIGHFGGGENARRNKKTFYNTLEP